MAAVPFILSWFLKEVPLRTTLGHTAELSVEEAVAGGTPEERIAPNAPDANGARGVRVDKPSRPG